MDSLICFIESSRFEESHGRVHRRSATDMGPRPGSAGEAFTLAFLDPPYGKGLGEQTLARLLEGDWLAPGAVVVFRNNFV